MTPESAAFTLSGTEYGEEMKHRAFFAEMAKHGLVAVWGASDDLMEFEGAIRDELGAHNGRCAYVTKGGLLTSRCDDGDNCPYFKDEQKKAATIRAVWNPDQILSWAIETTIPHATFTTMEDGEPFCRGIVFNLADVKEPASG